MVVAKNQWPGKSRTTVGVLVMVTGVILLINWPFLFNKIVDTELILSEKSTSFKLWKDLPIPVYMEFYLFNWTNPEDLGREGTKPIFQELGPYVYRENRQKVVDAWNSNGTITFRQNRTWHFEPSMSTGSEDDVITTINIVAATAEFACSKLDFFSKFVVDSAILATSPSRFIHAKVREILFEGYDDPILNLASLLPPGILPVNIPMAKFGMLYGRNGSADYDGIFNMRTGAGDLSQLGELAQWNHKEGTNLFESHCGAINGSAGELFPPQSNKDTPISAFSPEICRTVTFPYDKDTQVDGIPAIRYTAGEELFGATDSNPDNWCFCTNEDKATCPPSGVMELSGCKWGAAAYLSFPHFYKADASYREAIEGMNSDPEKHETFVDLEPRLGAPLQGSVAFQINIMVEEIEGFSLFEGVPRTFVPTMWFRQAMRIDEEFGLKLRCILIYLPQALNLISYISILAGFCLVLSAGFSLFRQSPRKVSIKYAAVNSIQPI